MKSWQIKALVACLVLIIILAIRWFGIHENISLASVQQHSNNLKQLVFNHYWLSVLLFCCLFILVVALVIPVSIMLTLLSGFLFGTIPGGFYSSLSATVGATINFLVVRYIFHDAIYARYGNRLESFNNEIKERGFFYIVSLLLFPITPFALVTILSALSDISVHVFSAATLVGIFPVSMLYAYAGKELLSLTSTSDVWSMQVLLLLIVLAGFAIIPIIVHYLRHNFKRS